MPADAGLPITSAAISLAVILVLLALAAWAAARLRRGGFNMRQGATPIAIIATRIVGPQASLMLVEAEGQRFLVGAGRAGITVITPLGAAPARADEPFETVLARVPPVGDAP
jgi:flagellar biogenesis protein FliO